jgi:hypothetical protein
LLYLLRSGIGTQQKFADVRYSVAIGGKAEIISDIPLGEPSFRAAERGCGFSLIGVFSTGVMPGVVGSTLGPGSSLLAKDTSAHACATDGVPWRRTNRTRRESWLASHVVGF